MLKLLLQQSMHSREKKHTSKRMINTSMNKYCKEQFAQIYNATKNNYTTCVNLCVTTACARASVCLFCVTYILHYIAQFSRVHDNKNACCNYSIFGTAWSIQVRILILNQSQKRVYIFFSKLFQIQVKGTNIQLQRRNAAESFGITPKDPNGESKLDVAV